MIKKSLNESTPQIEVRSSPRTDKAPFWERLSESVYNVLPLPSEAKLQLKSFLFRNFPFLFKHTSAYYYWNYFLRHDSLSEQKSNAEIRRFSKAFDPISWKRVEFDWLVTRDQLASIIKKSTLFRIRLADVIGKIPTREFSSDELAAHVEQISFLHRNRGSSDDRVRVSIIVPVFNQLHLTLLCIKSVLMWPSRYSFEIIIVDDCSNDLTPVTLSKMDAVCYVRNTENKGFVVSCNLGAAQSTGEYLVILNNDTVVLPGWLDELIGTLETIPNVGLAGSKLIFPDGNLQEAGGIVWANGSAWNYGRYDDPRRPIYNFSRDCDYLSGASLALRRELWDSLGGFDHRYVPAYYEDTDLAYRVRERGYRVLYQPLSKLYHFEGATSGTSLTEGVKKYQVVNHEQFFARWADVIANNKMPENATAGFEDRKSTFRILIIDARTATPDMDSGSNDMFQYLKIFKSLGFHVTFVPENLAHLGHYTEDLQRIGIECLYRPYVTTLTEAIDYLRQPPDVILLSRFYVAAPIIDKLRRKFPKAKVVFNTVDLHFLREQREAELLDSDELRELAEETKQVELNVMQKSDATIVLGDYEQDLVRELAPNVACYQVPIPREVPGRRDTDWAERKDILFVGGFEHPPNVDAVQHFAVNIWPLVRKKKLGACFIVVGSKMTEDISKLAGDDIVVKGFVPDLGPVLDRVRLTVAPLRYGSGVKGKVITSLSHGIPCVASSVAVEGSQFEHGVHLLVADNPQEAADEIARAYTQRELWIKLSNNGISLCREQYSVQSVGRHLAALIQDLGINVPDDQKADARG